MKRAVEHQKHERRMNDRSSHLTVCVNIGRRKEKKKRRTVKRRGQRVSIGEEMILTCLHLESAHS